MTTVTFVTVLGETITTTVSNYRVKREDDDLYLVVGDYRSNASWAPGPDIVAVAEAFSHEDAQFIADAFNARTA